MILTRFVAAVTQRVASEVEVINCLQVWTNTDNLLSFMAFGLTLIIYCHSWL